MYAKEIVVMVVVTALDHFHVETLVMQVHPEADLEIVEEHVMTHRRYDYSVIWSWRYNVDYYDGHDYCVVDDNDDDDDY